MIDNLPNNKQLILFDGVCNLCNSSVLFVIKHDKQNRFLFAPLQSKVGKYVIDAFNINTSKTDSIILYKPNTNKIYYKSSAALQVAKQLSFPTNLMAIFFVVPPFIRNYIYDFVAKHRYKWYGKKDHCMIPTPELNARFLA